MIMKKQPNNKNSNIGDGECNVNVKQKNSDLMDEQVTHEAALEILQE